MRYAIFGLAAVLLLSPIAAAQNDGDAVLTVWSSSTTHLLAVTPGGVVNTIMTRPGTSLPDGLAAAPANDGGLMVEGTTSPVGRHVVKFQGASASTLATLPASFTKVPTLMVDAGGDILVLNCTGNDRGVYRMPGRGGPVATLAHNTVNASFTAPFAMTEELISGDIVVLDVNRKLHRINPLGKVTTVAVVFPPSMALVVTGNVHVDVGTGLMHVTFGNYFLGLDPNTGATTTIYQPTAASRSSYYGLDGDPFGSGYYLTEYRTSPGPTGYYLMRYHTPTGVLSTVATLPTGTLTDVVTWKSRILGGLVRPVHGQAYLVRMTVPSEAGKFYFAAASLSTLPGIPVGGNRRIPLNPDLFFFLSMQVPSIFSGFQGVLDAAGTATLTVNLPPLSQLVGFRIFLAAITYDVNGIRVITEPLGVTIE